MSTLGEFDPVAYARQELVPLLRVLCELTRDGGEVDQHAFFGRILQALEHAREAADLAAPFMELSTSAFLGFDYDAATTLLLDQALECAQLLSESLALEPGEVN